jgi:ABC-type antimicrobial peptide transport system permease subunit
MREKIKPPQFASTFLQWFCNEKYREEIEGDLYELYEKRIENKGLVRAKSLYLWDVFRFFRIFYFKRNFKIENSNQIAMIKNYFKVGVRNIFKQKLTSAINIFGLSAAIAVSIVAFLYLDWQYRIDGFHENADNIYQVTNFMNRNGTLEEWGDSPEPLGPALKSETSVVRDFARVNITTGIIKYEDKVFEETVHFVDPQFLEIFSFPVDVGNTRVLFDPESIVITGKIAAKYFGNEDPIGKQITITFDRKYKESFIVHAVTDKIPDDSALGYDFLISYEKQKNIPSFNSLNSWGNFTDATFILVNPNSDPGILAAEFSKYVKLQNEAKSQWITEKFALQPLKTLSLNSYRIRGSISFGNQPHGNMTVAIIAFLMLLLACFNYMNIAVVSATGRLKEIGLRKVVGSKRSEIVVQFLAENILMCSFSLLLGVGIASYFLLPGFNSLLPFDVPFSFSSNWMAISFFGGTLFFVALVSGAYPALYISSFNPVVIFRGNMKFGSKGWLSKTLLTVQFIIAFMTIVSGLIFSETSAYFKKKDWGYRHHEILAIPIDGEKHYTALRNELQNYPDVVEISGATHHLGMSAPLVNVEHKNKTHQVRRFQTGATYPQMLGMKLIDGRFFSEEIESDKQAVLVNRKFVSNMGWENPTEETIWYDSVRYTVIGVVENFHYYNFYAEIDPAMIIVTEESNFNFLAARIRPGSMDNSTELVKAGWKKVEPDLPYDGFVQARVFENFFNNVDANISIIRFVAVLALILSCMGLFGLVSFNVSKRMKDFSIQRVLGAGQGVIIQSVNKGFIWILLIAMVVGCFFGYIAMNNLTSMMFPDREPIGIMPLVWSAVFIFSTALITISAQVYKVLRSKPVDLLRNE